MSRCYERGLTGSCYRLSGQGDFERQSFCRIASDEPVCKSGASATSPL